MWLPIPLRAVLGVVCLLLCPQGAFAAEDEIGAAQQASRGDAEPDRAENADGSETAEPCLRPPVALRYLRRPREATRLALTTCDGEANAEAIVPLSLLARAFRAPLPSDAELVAGADSERWLVPGIRRMDPGLLLRLQALADRWPDREIVVVSGHRPHARRGSRHRHGRALDVRVEGVPRAEVAAFAQSLPETGVGYYPNSSFTHIDVRRRATYWVDRSGPGEPADYGPWPRTEGQAVADSSDSVGDSPAQAPSVEDDAVVAAQLPDDIAQPSASNGALGTPTVEAARNDAQVAERAEQTAVPVGPEPAAPDQGEVGEVTERLLRDVQVALGNVDFDPEVLRAAGEGQTQSPAVVVRREPLPGGARRVGIDWTPPW